MVRTHRQTDKHIHTHTFSFIYIDYTFTKSPQNLFGSFGNYLFSSDGASILLAICVYRMPVSWLKCDFYRIFLNLYNFFNDRLIQSR